MSCETAQNFCTINGQTVADNAAVIGSTNIIMPKGTAGNLIQKSNTAMFWWTAFSNIYNYGEYGDRSPDPSGPLAMFQTDDTIFLDSYNKMLQALNQDIITDPDSLVLASLTNDLQNYINNFVIDFNRCDNCNLGCNENNSSSGCTECNSCNIECNNGCESCDSCYVYCNSDTCSTNCQIGCEYGIA